MKPTEELNFAQLFFSRPSCTKHANPRFWSGRDFNYDRASGGQKARVGLARAIYRDADVYLLDDPLSAVDAHVGRQIFENCVRGYLEGKTVVLVTHQIQYARQVDRLILLSDGRAVKSGSFEEVSEEAEEFFRSCGEGGDTDEDAAEGQDRG